MIHRISFPNIGINDLEINRVAFPNPEKYPDSSIQVYWYGIIIVSAIMLAIAYVFLRARKTEITEDNIYDLSIWLVLGGILGARAYYVLTSLDKYDSFFDFFKIWEGGLGIYGGIIGGAIAALIVCKVKKINFPLLADLVGPALLLAQGVGRWGNFFNAEAYGSVTTWDFFGVTFDITGCEKLPWIMHITDKYGALTVAQPTFLYEFVWNMIGFVLLALLFKKRAYNGQIFLGYIVWYGSMRMIVEGFRTDSLPLGSNLRISQVLAAVCIVIGITALILLAVLKKKDKLPVFLDRERIMFPKVSEDDKPYEPMFEEISTKTSEETESEEEEDNGTDN